MRIKIKIEENEIKNAPTPPMLSPSQSYLSNVPTLRAHTPPTHPFNVPTLPMLTPLPILPLSQCSHPPI